MNLSAKQRYCLLHYSGIESGSGYQFGSGTLSSLRKRSLIERFTDNGATLYRITDAGRAESKVST